LQPGIENVSVVSLDNVTVDMYVVLSPDEPTINPLTGAAREWIRITAITGNTITGMDRGLPGSVEEGLGSLHPSGAIIRAVFTKQLQDDIFDDIDELEGKTADLPGTYLALGGTNTMTAALPLKAGAPSAAWEAANKEYVDVEAASAEADAVTAANHHSDTNLGLHKDNNPGAHHTKYLDTDAVTALENADVYIENTGDTVEGDLGVTGKVEVGGQVHTIGIRAATEDLTFANAANDELLRWDDVPGAWEFKQDVTLEGHVLSAPADPTAGNHVGDQDFNDARYPVTEDGAMGLTTPYGCDVHSSTAQSIPADEWTLLGMDTERYDPHDDFSRTAGEERYTVPKAGLYVFGAEARMNAADVTQLRIQVGHSTGAAYEQETYPAGNSNPFISVFGMRFCNAGETLRARIYQSSPGARSTRSDATKFWAARLS